MPYPAYDHESSYVSQQPAWRIIFVSLLVAASLGFSFRLYFSPQRIKGWIEVELRRQPTKLDLKFTGAELRLSRGAIPQLALRLTDVRGRSEKSCAREPGFRVSEIFIPFRVLPLFEGQVSVGTVHGAHLVIDLDALRDRCERERPDHSDSPVAAATSDPPLRPPGADSVGSTTRPSRSEPVASTSLWWTPAQIQTIKNLVSGLSFESVELRFEKGAKRVFFGDLLVRADVDVDALAVVTDVRAPAELLYGQQLPPFELEATVRPDAADVEIKGHLAEGTLNGLATLKAMPGDLSIDAHLQATSVPLAALIPFLQTAGWKTSDWQPRFLWLQCEASIKGRVKNLFRESPLSIEKCSLDGESGRLSVDRALVGPGPKLEPFEVALAGVDVEKVLEMFGKKGPTGVMSKLGRLSGRIQVRSRDDVSFDGALLDSQFLFSRSAVRVHQPVAEIRLKLTRGAKGWGLSTEQLSPVRGNFEGRIAIELSPDLSSGRIDVAISELNLSPEVQMLLIGGGWRHLRLKGSGDLKGGNLEKFKGELTWQGVEAADFRLPEARAQVSSEMFREGSHERSRTVFDVKTSAGEILRTSTLFASLGPLFLGHEFRENWILFKDSSAQLHLEGRDLRWERASAQLRGGQIWITSSGIARDDGGLDGWISVDYPRLKKLRWDLSGSTRKPKLEPTARTRRETGDRLLNDTALGLFVRTKDPEVDRPEPSRSGLKSLGAKVLERAKAILPEIEATKDATRPEAVETRD